MKFLCSTVFVFIFALGIFAQTKPLQPLTDEAIVREIFLAKDNGEGKPGDPVDGFSTTDTPIYCVVQLDSLKPVVVKMNFVAVAVKGVKPETKVISVNYKTNGEQSRVYFSGKPDGKWFAGTYRAEIFIDGKPAGSKEFQIQTPVHENPLVQTLQPKQVKRKRKN